MSRDIDLSKPLSDEDVADLKARFSLEYVDRLVALAQGSDFADDNGGTSPDDEQPSEKWTAKRLTAYAEEHGVSLEGVANKKADLLAAIEGHGSSDEDEDTVFYWVHLTEGRDNISVSIPSDTPEEEVGAAVKDAAIEAGFDEEELTGYSLANGDGTSD